MIVTRILCVTRTVGNAFAAGGRTFVRIFMSLITAEDSAGFIFSRCQQWTAVPGILQVLHSEELSN